MKKTPDPICWTPEAKDSFTSLRQSLSGSPVLHNLNFSRSFDVAMDASGTGLGAVLSQHIDQEQRPILFISQKLTPAEQNCFTVEKEALTVKWAVGIVHYYLLHNPFQLWVDHELL